MNDCDSVKEFWDRADEFISLANQQVKGADEGKVSASMMYAAARFNVFTSAFKTKEKIELIALKESFTEYLLDQYRKALKENFEDYINNYKNYVNNQT